MHNHMYMHVHVGLLWTEFFMTALALYSSVKTVLVEVDHVPDKDWERDYVP